ncbi:unnamed protein product [Enterobius vermicularis]|uniref:non-specific serine/threonine protein kinase n=1 Tax=Enterobius vermicularis TaxID=51028 RepID=A0A0N4VMP4_ENTVE|nr:unnamed protein product [Enterobius vermicularis]
MHYAPLVEVLVFSRECGALVLSPCRIQPTIEERKYLYHWDNVERRPKNTSFGNRLKKCNQGTSGNSCEKSENPESPTTVSNGDLNGNVPSEIIESFLKPLFFFKFFCLIFVITGSGGFGTVFVSKYNHKKVAIKQLHYRRHSSSEDFWSLCAELNAFRLPRSPNIATVLSFISSDSKMQIVTEFVCGRDLQKMIDDDQWIIHTKERKAIAYQIASGLAHCHSHRLLHLDVKPSNVLLSEDLETCKLTDFGCSRVATEVSCGLLIAPNSTNTSSFGTIAFKAPELLKSGRPTDRADIYSYSLLLYELLSRHAPYQGLHPHTIIFLVAGQNMRPELDEVKQKLVKEGIFSLELTNLLLSRLSV